MTGTVRIELAEPIPYGEHRITHVYYGHLSELEVVQPEGAPHRRPIAAGQRLGISGRANHVAHLHLGLLLDGDTSQRWGTFLGEAEVRDVLGGYRNGTRLPDERR